MTDIFSAIQTDDFRKQEDREPQKKGAEEKPQKDLFRDFYLLTFPEMGETLCQSLTLLSLRNRAMDPQSFTSHRERREVCSLSGREMPTG
jgi:hypothetical protein